MFQKQHNNALGIVIIMLAVVACSSQQQRPEWIDQPSNQYPATTHLTAVGSADDQQTAGDRAITNLGKIFEVQVQELSQDSSSAFVVSSQGQQQIENTQSISRDINVETNKVLQGVKVVEYWQSEVGRYYGLAVLAKQPAASGFSQAILKADKDIHNLIQYASNQAENPLVALKALKQAATLQSQRDENNRSLMIVRDGNGIKGKYDSAAIDKLTRDALSTLKVQVEASNESVKAELQQAMAQLGVETVAQSNLVLQGGLDVAPVSFQQGWFWQRGAYELTFKDGNKVLAKQRYPVKVSAREADMVEQRLKDELNQNLPRYVFGLMSASTQ